MLPVPVVGIGHKGFVLFLVVAHMIDDIAS